MSESIEVVTPKSPNPVITGIGGFFSHPSLVWFYLLWVNTLLAMIIFNIARVGFTPEGIFGGPEYFGSLFWYYGLNQNPAYITPFNPGILSWIFSPFIAIFLGIPLYVLMEAGWSPIVDSKIKDLGTKDYAFFPENPFGYDVSFGAKKFNVFFIGIVWLPIIISSIMLVIYMDKTKRSVHPVLTFVIGFIIAMTLGLEFGRIQSPDYYLDFQKGWESLTQFRNRSILVQNYDSSNYHPTGIGFLMASFHIVAMIVGVVVAAIMAIPKKYREFQIASEIRAEKRRQTGGNESLKTPPWIIEREKRKEEFLKKKEEETAEKKAKAEKIEMEAKK